MNGVVQGDALHLPLADESIDAVVCDPPYGLEFMGKDWDTHSSPAAFAEWCEAWAREAHRVLKPGGHLLAFGGTRTSHRLACGIEDAGFELRDAITWLYGQGFPKSLDVGKAIDKRATVNDETARRIAAVAAVVRRYREARGMTPTEVSTAVVGTPSGACWNWEHQQIPSVAMWPTIKSALGIPDAFDGLIEGDRAQFIAAEREVIGQRTTGIGTGNGSVPIMGDGDDKTVTAPATDAAKQWDGWGTALKPASEPIIVARKPLDERTVAGNVQTWGTGALNVDGCRIAGVVPSVPQPRLDVPTGIFGRGIGRNGEMSTSHAAGRWPTNVVLTHTPDCDLVICAVGCPVAELDAQSGTLTSVGSTKNYRTPDKSKVWGTYEYSGRRPDNSYAGAGGASRFFPTFRYQAKADSAERLRDGTVAHPTVKPLELMRWLVRLVTPSGGLVLDPFAGSGTTAEAALLEGFHCIAIERDSSYLPLIHHRLNRRLDPVTYLQDTGTTEYTLFGDLA